MENLKEVIEMESWIKIVLGNAAVIGFLWFILQRYTVALISKRFEPLTAQEVLRRQNLLNSRLKAYTRACELVCSSMAAEDWNGPDVPKDRTPEDSKPKESEINSCAAGLAMFSDNEEVRHAFLKCFQKPSPVDLGKFIEVLRQDLGYGESKFKPDEYPYIFGNQKKAEQDAQSDGFAAA